MKLKDMKIGIRYKVVKGSKSGALQTGDRIWIEETNYCGCILMCQEAGGWLNDWSGVKAEVEVDTGYYKKKIDKAKEELAYLTGLVHENV